VLHSIWRAYVRTCAASFCFCFCTEVCFQDYDPEEESQDHHLRPSNISTFLANQTLHIIVVVQAE
jgi:hypothetical protein